MTIAISITRIICQVIILYIFICSIYHAFNESKIDKQKRLQISFILLFSAILIEFSTSILSHYPYFLFIIPMAFIYKIILKCENKDLILNMAFSFVITSLSETVAHLFTKFYRLFPISRHVVSAKNFFETNLIMLALSLLLTCIAYQVIKNNNSKIREIVTHTNTLDVFFSSTFALCVLAPFLLYFYYDKYNLKLYVLITTLTSFALFFKYQSDIISTNSKDIQSERTTRRLCNVVDNLKLINHDYHNILLTLNGYVTTKQYEGLEQYIKKLTNEVNQIATTESLNPTIINQPAVYGIVDSKYFDALDKNIKVNVAVDTDIKEINFDFADLSRVLGILLDNAIEATQKAESKELSIKFSYNKKKQADMIEIKNSISPDLDIDIEKIFNKGESSKEKKSGYGLWEVKNIIESKDNSQIYTNIDDNIFSQTIIIEKA